MGMMPPAPPMPPAVKPPEKKFKPLPEVQADIRSRILNDRTKDGSLLVPSGSEVTFRYRLHCHAGDARAARVDEQFLNYVFAPEPQWVEEP
jgi:hypothetical protein